MGKLRKEALAEQQGGLMLVTRLCLRKKRGSTFTAPLDLPTPVESIVDEIRQAPIQVYRGQAALKSIPGGHKFWEVAVHALS